jgi:hypothetical protein
MQRKRLMKNQQEVKVFFKRSLVLLVVWEFEKMLGQFNHPLHY